MGQKQQMMVVDDDPAMCEFLRTFVTIGPPPLAAREAECALILRMLTRPRWNRKEAAEILGIRYKALLYKIKENGLDTVS